MFFFLLIFWGTKEMAQWLRLLAALSDDLSTVPSAHIDRRKLPMILTPEGSIPAASIGAHTHVHMPTYTHIINVFSCFFF